MQLGAVVLLEEETAEVDILSSGTESVEGFLSQFGAGQLATIGEEELLSA